MTRPIPPQAFGQQGLPFGRWTASPPEIAGVQRGMEIAIPPEAWGVFQRMTEEALVETLRRLAGNVRWAAFRRHPRGPKKPPVKRK